MTGPRPTTPPPRHLGGVVTRGYRLDPKQNPIDAGFVPVVNDPVRLRQHLNRGVRPAAEQSDHGRASRRRSRPDHRNGSWSAAVARCAQSPAWHNVPYSAADRARSCERRASRGAGPHRRAPTGPVGTGRTPPTATPHPQPRTHLPEATPGRSPLLSPQPAESRVMRRPGRALSLCGPPVAPATHEGRTAARRKEATRCRLWSNGNWN